MPSPSGARRGVKSEAGVSEGTRLCSGKDFQTTYVLSEVPAQSCGRHPDEASDV